MDADPCWLVHRLMKSNFGICDAFTVYMGKRRVSPVPFVIHGGLFYTLGLFLVLGSASSIIEGSYL